MAITKADVHIWFKLADEGLIPPDPDVLELGEAEWYGDYHYGEIPAIIEKYARPADRKSLIDAAESLIHGERPVAEMPLVSFDFARLFYIALLRYKTITTIDLGGTDNAQKFDLNLPVNSGKQFDIIINTGTFEHLFNISQGFRTSHDLCKPAGLMFHAFPFQGWLDHGFWNINPTLLADLASVNRYQQVFCVYFEPETGRVEWLGSNPVVRIHAMAKANTLGRNSLLYIVWRKRTDADFVIPQQGHYANTLAPELQKDWLDMR